MKHRSSPLTGIRVLNLGGSWPGRVASLLLAEQGAEVLEIEKPDKDRQLEDALLSRGKTAITLDLKTSEGQARAQALAAGADIVIANLGIGQAARFGLDYPTLKAANPGLVYVSVPGFAEAGPMAATPGWEGTVAASVGVYTDVHALGPILGGEPTFTAVPMASAYGGVHAAIAATLGLLNRIETGHGQSIETPLADAVLSSMALLIMKIDGQPRRFDLPPIDKSMTDVAFPILRDLDAHLGDAHRARIKAYLAASPRPQFGNHRCADGRFLFINAVDHVHHAKACLDTLGVLNDLIAEGMVVGSPFEEGGNGNNVSSSQGLSPAWANRLQAVMAARFLTRPAQEWETLLRRAGVPASVVRTTDEWMHLPTALVGGNVGDLDDPEWGLVRQPGRFVTIEGERVASPPLAARRLAVEAGWPRERTGNETASSDGAAADTRGSTAHGADGGEARGAANDGRILAGVRVLDLSNVIAGPASARILAEFGAQVTRVDPPAPYAGPRMTMWFGVDVNQGKRSIILDLKTDEGRQVLARLVRRSDVVIHNFLDRSAEKIGLSEAQLRQWNPSIISCQISAWGGPAGGPLKDDPAFDPVLQAATGVTARYGTPQAPVLHGLASCVDYITGFSAALGIAQALVARALGHGGSHVRTSLSMGAQLVQFPFTVASATHRRPAEPAGQGSVGYGSHYRKYRTAGGWAFLAARSRDIDAVAARLGAADASDAAIAEALSGQTVEQASQRLRDLPAASLVPIERLDALRERLTVEAPGQFDPASMRWAMLRGDHPSGHRVSLPLPTWYRFASGHAAPLSPAFAPGTHTRELLAELGLTPAETQRLFGQDIARDGWAVLEHYLPH
ncbi:MAG: CoA transferase [Burkholderiaceae bacterium]